MNMDSNLNVSRRKVQSVLKDKMKRYLALLGNWFRGKLSKEEFDGQARLLFTEDTVRVHNQFLLAILKRCQSVGSALGTRDLNRVPSIITMQSPPPVVQRQRSAKAKPASKANFTQRFQPANQLRQVQRLLTPPASTKMSFASSDHGLLPDPGMVEGRLYVAAWESGLENVQDDIYTMISLATEEMLKNVVSHMISCRRGYRISQAERVKQYVGIDVPTYFVPSAYDTAKEEIDDAVLLAQREEAHSVQTLAKAGSLIQRSEPITARDMFTALMSNPDILGSYTMYTLAMERLSSRLYHPNVPDHVTSGS